MKESFKIEKVAVLGTGVMGAQIAAHLTNAQIPVLGFDMNQEVAEKGIEASANMKPSAYYNPKTVKMITPLNYDDHINQLSECDWIIEVIAERLDWKQELYSKIEPHLKKDAIITSNTSGISADELISKMDENMAKRFFITHFFNPPRYMKLVEIILSKKTDTNLIPPMVEFLEETLGKGVVYAKDTPNFIANRIGVYGMMVTLDEARKKNLSIEDVDELIGTNLTERVRNVSIAIYERAAKYALGRGIIIADTKFEFGYALDTNGEPTNKILLIDEVLTPDSSRFWPADDYETGREQDSFDKQYVRNWLQELVNNDEWDKTSPGPVLPDEIVSNTIAKYKDAAARLFN